MHIQHCDNCVRFLGSKLATCCPLVPFCDNTTYIFNELQLEKNYPPLKCVLQTKEYPVTKGLFEQICVLTLKNLSSNWIYVQLIARLEIEFFHHLQKNTGRILRRCFETCHFPKMTRGTKGKWAFLSFFLAFPLILGSRDYLNLSKQSELRIE